MRRELPPYHQDAIKVDALSKHFGDFVAVNKISFTVQRGEVFGFLGANGAGKTTAIRMLIGLLKPTSGQASVAGFDITHQAEPLKRHIGYMSQRFSLYDDLSIQENFNLFGGIYGLSRSEIKEKSRQTLETLDLTEHRDVLLSGIPLGWKQKLAFSIALIHNPKIVFLDEPTGGVDPITRRQFWELIYKSAEEGTTVFVTTHYMDEAEYCDRICIMNNGVIEVIGSPSEIKEQFQAESIDQVFIKIARPNGVLL
jgi:ABC-2 type transport system ATP-binding protein